MAEGKMSRIKHIAISSQDPTKTSKFYKDSFGLIEVGEINNEFVEGFYLSDGYINLAILNFKTEALAGEEFGTNFSGLHHIGFQVSDAEAADTKLKKAGSTPREDINSAFLSQMGKGHGGKNSEMKYSAPDDVLIDISQDGWVGT